MNRELVRQGQNGFLADADEEWVLTLDRLLSDAALASRVGEAGRRTVLDEYSVAVVGSRLVSMLGGPSAGPRA